jgi:TRAP-type uncharacterized transport system substrate-binding protein
MKQLRKWSVISCFIILIVCIVLPACSGGTTTPTNTSSTVNPNQQVGIVNIGTHAIGTYYNILGTALGKTIEGHTSMKAKVIPLSGPVAWMPMMLTKEMDIGLCTALTLSGVTSLTRILFHVYLKAKDFRCALSWWPQVMM